MSGILVRKRGQLRYFLMKRERQKLTAGGYFQRLDKPRQHQRMSETLGRELTANRLAGERIWLDG